MIAPGLRVLFCGINPGLYTAAVGHHFARPGNRFWPALFAAGFTDRLVSPFDERELLKSGYGVTNVVMRATATADQLSREELRAGGDDLRKKLKRLSTRISGCVGTGSLSSCVGQTKSRYRPSGRKNWQHHYLGVAKSERSERPLPGKGS